MARAWAEVDLGAVAHNVAALRSLVRPARLCAVVVMGVVEFLGPGGVATSGADAHSQRHAYEAWCAEHGLAVLDLSE